MLISLSAGSIGSYTGLAFEIYSFFLAGLAHAALCSYTFFEAHCVQCWKNSTYLSSVVF